MGNKNFKCLVKDGDKPTYVSLKSKFKLDSMVAATQIIESYWKYFINYVWADHELINNRNVQILTDKLV